MDMVRRFMFSIGSVDHTQNEFSEQIPISWVRTCGFIIDGTLLQKFHLLGT